MFVEFLKYTGGDFTVNYLPRIIDEELEECLESFGAVSIIGPKGCGKTTTAKQYANSFIKMDDSRKGESFIELANTDPLLLLKGANPHLIDEWQFAPRLWGAVRVSVDDLDGDGLYILTSSKRIDESKIMHSGIGRIHRLKMMPMSLYESGESNGKIAIKDLFENPNLNINGIESDLLLEDLIFASCRGGWPEALKKKTNKSKLELAKKYLKYISNTGILTVDNVKRNPNMVEAILKSYARNISTLTTNKTILEDINLEVKTSKTTYYDYINALKGLLIINNINGWSPNIMSKNKIRCGSKKYFIDPSIGVAALDLSPEDLVMDFKTFTPIFENLCIRDLSIYASAIGGNIYYYHDSSDLEVDCVLSLNNGNYALIEFKLSNNAIDEGSKNLLKLDEKIKNKIKEGSINIPEPSFLAIIYAGNIAYTRRDGVKVLPISTLK